MLSWPDFKEKKILFIQAEFGNENLLQLSNGNIRFSINGEVVNQMSVHNIFAVFIVGELSITTALIKKLVSYGISIFFLNQNFAGKASAIMAEAAGNWMLRTKQYENKSDITIAKNIVLNKIRSQLATVKKAKKIFEGEIFQTAEAMVENADTIDKLLGIEGNIARYYFQNIFLDIGWNRRAPQTKEDISNLLLDIGYTYLFNYCDCLLSLFGFDTYKGYYHQLFFQRKSLVCDVIEPMRPIIDNQLLKSHNLNQIHEKDFIFRNGRFEFKNGFKTSKVYSAYFLEAINTFREPIYLHILQFYRYVMDPKKYPFPFFTINK